MGHLGHGIDEKSFHALHSRAGCNASGNANAYGHQGIIVSHGCSRVAGGIGAKLRKHIASFFFSLILLRLLLLAICQFRDDNDKLTYDLTSISSPFSASFFDYKPRLPHV